MDFGRNFTGVPEVDLRVPEGTRVTFRYGELLHPDGSLNPLTSVCGQIKGTRKKPDGSEDPVGGPGAPPIAWQQDVFIARGDGLERFRPDFTFHGFRFMEITGLPKAPEPSHCRTMNLITVQKLGQTLEEIVSGDLQSAISVPEGVARRARVALERMLEVGK